MSGEGGGEQADRASPRQSIATEAMHTPVIGNMSVSNCIVWQRAVTAGAALILIFAEIFCAHFVRTQGVSGPAPELGHDPSLPAILLH